MSFMRSPDTRSFPLMYAAGGLYSTAGDLYKWDQALYTEKLVSKATLDAIFTPNLSDYGYGWQIEKGALGKVSEAIAADLRRDDRHHPHGDRRCEQIRQDGDRAAQQAGVEAGDHGDGQSGIHRDIETVHDGLIPSSMIRKSGYRFSEKIML